MRKIFMIIIVCMLSCLNMQAQDAMVAMAKKDVTMKSLETLKLRNLKISSPYVSDLYDDFDTKKTHVKSENIPDSVRISLLNFSMPTNSTMITSHFGKRWNRFHKGIDIKVYIGDKIKSAFNGKVRIVGYDKDGYGNFVIIRHPNGLETYYGHLSQVNVKVNQNVKSGEVIGLGGNTGRSTGSHLHFETRLCGVAIDPRLIFDFVHQDIVADYFLFKKSNMTTISKNINKK